MAKKFKLRVIFLDDDAAEIFNEGGLRKVRRVDEKDYLNYEVVEKVFDTEAEEKAYIDALYDFVGRGNGYTVYNFL